MKKMLFILGFTFLFSGSLFSEKTKQSDLFIIGTTSGYAPFVSLNDQGEYEGFDIDVANSIANKLGKQLVIKDFGSMPSLMLALKQEKVDALIWAISITEERLKKMEMIYYQGEKVTEMPFLFWETIPEEIKTIADLAKSAQKSISIEAGSYQEDILKTYSGILLKYNDKITDALLELRYGKSLAALVDPSLVDLLKKQYPQLKSLYLPLPPEKYSLGNGICLSKKNPELTDKVKKAVAEMIEEGTIQKLEKKWNLSKNQDSNQEKENG